MFKYTACVKISIILLKKSLHLTLNCYVQPIENYLVIFLCILRASETTLDINIDYLITRNTAIQMCRSTYTDTLFLANTNTCIMK